jgi:hypothetical protein
MQGGSSLKKDIFMSERPEEWTDKTEQNSAATAYQVRLIGTGYSRLAVGCPRDIVKI